MWSVQRVLKYFNLAKTIILLFNLKFNVNVKLMNPCHRIKIKTFFMNSDCCFKIRRPLPSKYNDRKTGYSKYN